MNTGSPAQVAVVLWFLLICPGMMAVRFLQLNDWLVEWMLAITISLVIDTFIAGFLLMVRSWSPQNAFSSILIVTVVAAVIQVASQSPIEWRIWITNLEWQWRAWMEGPWALVKALVARIPDDDSVAWQVIRHRMSDDAK
jgi:hypothetical protein